jgi:Kdo2-lipid IVA lauroyltransferase/acyltransferase
VKKIGIYIFLGFSWFLSIVPEFILYGIADFFYVVLYYIVGYRRNTVYTNLTNSFPDKPESEIKQITKKFYHQLSDIFIENIAIFKMSQKRVLRMVKLEETDIYKKLYNNNKSIIGVTAHYSNWEVFLTLPEIVPHTVFGVYKPLKNTLFDKEFYKMREKFGAVPITMNDTFKTILKLHKENKLTFLGLIADQRPIKINKKYWTTFLNQETAVYLGPEKIAQKLNHAIIFTYLEKIKRGRYIIKTKLLFDDVSQCKEYEITETHLRFLEKLIIENPENYLWTHKRWKFKKGDPNY